MNRVSCFVALICICLVGATSCRRHRTPKKISFVRNEPSRNKNGLASESCLNNREDSSKALSLLSIVGGVPSDNIFLQHTGFVVCYNPHNGTPSWVAWELTSEETKGQISRKDYDYMSDPQLEPYCQIEKGDYEGSGYDRGHMCPAGDMEWSSSAMNDCHYMTNICPQTPKLNQIYWERLESACRRWAVLYGSIYIVCGTIYTGESDNSIGTNHVVKVPNAFFKVVINLNNGEEKGIGFVYLNTNERQTMESASVSINQVEELTGYDFFCELPDELEEKIESQNKLSSWR